MIIRVAPLVAPLIDTLASTLAASSAIDLRHRPSPAIIPSTIDPHRNSAPSPLPSSTLFDPGAVAPSIVHAHQSIVAVTTADIERIVTDMRMHDVRAEIDSLAASFVHLKLDYDVLVKLLGGRKPSESGYVNPQGLWGRTSVGTSLKDYSTDVPIAMAHADLLIGRIWGSIAGCPGVASTGVGPKPDQDGLAHGLPHDLDVGLRGPRQSRRKHERHGRDRPVVLNVVPGD